jgi:hypothetical protein
MSENTIKFLQSQTSLSTDLEALLRTSLQWKHNQPLDVGESGTLYRFLQFADWKQGGKRTFIRSGTLKQRKITSDPSIISRSIAELLLLDNGTSQWASAAVLLGNDEPKPSDLPYKLALTYEALEHWQRARAGQESWRPRYDKTIERQAEAYVKWKQTGLMIFEPEQAEDYCFARAFELMTSAEGEKRWPSLRQHESDRIVEMEQALNQKTVSSRDHRVVQALAMRKGEDVQFAHPDVVAKSWPLFWDFYKASK